MTVTRRMPALTLHEPWGTAIVEGLKTEETRSWRPPFNKVGTPILVHTSQRRVPEDIDGDLRMALVGAWQNCWRDKLTYGAVVGEMVIDSFFQVDSWGIRRSFTDVGEPYWYPICKGQLSLGFPEEVPITPWGDYSVGRWIWTLKDVVRYDEPIPARGRQRFWYFDLALSLPEGL